MPTKYSMLWRTSVTSLGLTGSKKIQDVFVDEKVPVARRHVGLIFRSADHVTLVIDQGNVVLAKDLYDLVVIAF